MGRLAFGSEAIIRNVQAQSSSKQAGTTLTFDLMI